VSEAAAPAEAEGKKGKKKDKKAKSAGGAAGVSVRSHPRAARAVRRARAYAGLAGFLLTLLLSLSAHVPAQDALVRALIGGIALNLIAWRLSIAIWRQLIIGELRARHAELVERRNALAEAAAEAAAAAAAAS
jgi:hypothetical protein